MTAANDAPAVELRAVDKWFGQVHANRRVDLSVPPGTVHGIVGENGAGKTTLMNILYGFYRADRGQTLIAGKPVLFRHSGDAIATGIGMIHQHFMLVETFTAVENVMLGAEGSPLLGPAGRRARRMLAELEREFGLHVPMDVPVGGLPVGQQQRVEILKALYRGADILILDEPTSALSPREVEGLFRILRTLASQGKTIIFITHQVGGNHGGNRPGVGHAERCGRGPSAHFRHHGFRDRGTDGGEANSPGKQGSTGRAGAFLAGCGSGDSSRFSWRCARARCVVLGPRG